MVEYKARMELKPGALDGISVDQVAAHWALYEGYVTNVNRLNTELGTAIKEGKMGTPAFAEMNRRRGWEYNGMVLHEGYFGTMKPAAGDPPSRLKEAVDHNFGSWQAWKDEFTAIAKFRGVGWAIVYQDPMSRALTNHWISMHEDGHPAGYKPILILDVWEHAFVVDWKPNAAGRGSYIDAYFKNVDWNAVSSRLA